VPRLFVAIWPPEQLLSDLVALQRPAQHGVRWTTPEQWHVTLSFLGSHDASVLPDMERSLEEVTASYKGRAQAVAGPAPEPLSRRVWALPVGGLDLLAAAVREAVGRWESPDVRARPFRGHLTLARAKRGAPASTLAGLGRPPVRMSWAVQEVTLVASTTRPEGARYEVVAGWSFGH
jgi:2'-5' RNA ligase